MFSNRILLSGAALAMIAAPAEAQRVGWQNVSSATVHLGVTSETLLVRASPWARQLRLCVKRRAVGIRDVIIDFDRGADQRVSVRQIIHPGQCSVSAPIRLNTFRGRNAQIRSVRVDLTRIARGIRPIITLQAR